MVESTTLDFGRIVLNFYFLFFFYSITKTKVFDIRASRDFFPNEVRIPEIKLSHRRFSKPYRDLSLDPSFRSIGAGCPGIQIWLTDGAAEIGADF